MCPVILYALLELIQDYLTVICIPYENCFQLKTVSPAILIQIPVKQH